MLALAVLLPAGLYAAPKAEAASAKTGPGLAAHALRAVNENWRYVYGGYGQISGGTRVADCAGLIKSYLWWTDDSSNPRAGAVAVAGGANSMRNSASVAGSINRRGPRLHPKHPRADRLPQRPCGRLCGGAIWRSIAAIPMMESSTRRCAARQLPLDRLVQASPRCSTPTPDGSNSTDSPSIMKTANTSRTSPRQSAAWTIRSARTARSSAANRLRRIIFRSITRPPPSSPPPRRPALRPRLSRWFIRSVPRAAWWGPSRPGSRSSAISGRTSPIIMVKSRRRRSGAFQQQAGLSQTGKTDETTLSRLKADGAPVRPALTEGDAGDDVSRLQQRLAELLYFEETPDGGFGPVTAEAVAAFQTANGLEATGKAGLDTLTKLYSDAAAVNPTPGRCVPARRGRRFPPCRRDFASCAI